MYSVLIINNNAYYFCFKIVSICYIIYYIWEYNLNYGYTQYDPENSNELTFSKYRGIIEGKI